MKARRIPFVGFYLYIVAFVILLVAYILALTTFSAYSLSPDRFVVIFPLFAMWIIIVQVVMSFIDEDKPFWLNTIDLLFCFLVLFAFGRLLIPFLTPIGIYFTVNMGDLETYAIVVPRCIAGCVLFAVSCIVFITGSFFKVAIIKEGKE